VPVGLSTGRVVVYLLLALLSSMIVGAVFTSRPIIAVVLFGLAGASLLLLGVDLFRERPSGRILAGHIAHIGMALVLVGGAGSSLGEDFTAAMGPGETAQLDRYTIELETIGTGEADRFVFVVADIFFTGPGPGGFRLSPEIRAYEDQALPVPEPALRSTPVEDVVVAISRVAGDASVVEVNVFVRPLVLWVWVGAALIAVAGLIALVATGAASSGRRRAATTARQEAGTTT
ncbi:MAG TPA: cytochrome c-type biogenesis CcmF C-terminal domain-containing protein, partial [Acidimicrobiia bacterium]|nr:cytochrome c-type biogenesis CcmF C-terminal domain-containing protein [Acidimicrobiia bacterium]